MRDRKFSKGVKYNSEVISKQYDRELKNAWEI